MSLSEAARTSKESETCLSIRDHEIVLAKVLKLGKGVGKSNFDLEKLCS